MIWALWAIFGILCIGLLLVLEEFVKLRNELSRQQHYASQDRTETANQLSTALIKGLKKESSPASTDSDWKAQDIKEAFRLLYYSHRQFSTSGIDRADRLSNQIEKMIDELEQIRKRLPVTDKVTND